MARRARRRPIFQEKNAANALAPAAIGHKMPPPAYIDDPNMPLRQTEPSLLAAALLSLALCPPAAEAADPKLPAGYSAPPASASAADGQLRAHAEATLPVSCPKAWSVFTDFDSMARFLPGVQSSRAEFSSPGKAILTQRGSLRYGIFSKSYSSTRELTLLAPQSVESASVPSDEVPVWSSTTFSPTPAGGCEVRYSTKAGLPGWMPGFAAVDISKSMAASMMRAMIAEIERRYPASGPALEAAAAAPDPAASPAPPR